MATRRSSSRDGIISVLVLVMVAGGFWWWTSRQPVEESATATPKPGLTSIRPTSTKPNSTKPTTSKATPRPTTSKPATPKPTSTFTPPSFTPVKAGSYAVRWVSDGDTFSIKDANGKQLASVRVIGLNAPEVAHGTSKAECYGPQASAQLKKLLTGKTVKLVDDPRAPMFDRFGRRLAYVEVGGQDVAALMIRDGFAVEFHLPSAGPSVRTPGYLKAQAEAQRSKRGLWGSCPMPPGRSASS